jgi:hypothetical protein
MLAFPGSCETAWRPTNPGNRRRAKSWHPAIALKTAVNYYPPSPPPELTETTLQAFLGMKIMARCHTIPEMDSRPTIAAWPGPSAGEL